MRYLGKKASEKKLWLLISILLLLFSTCLSACKNNDDNEETTSPTTYLVRLEKKPALGGEVSGGGSYAKGVEIVLSSITNEGYQFSGWYEGETLLSLKEDYTYSVSKDVTITAVWKEGSYTIRFNTHDGGNLEEIKVPNGEKLIESSMPIPLKNGYIFEGWYYDNELNKKFDPTAEINASFTLYAKYTLPNDTFKSSVLVNDCTSSSSIIISSNVPITQANAANYVSLTSIEGDVLPISVIKASDGKYLVRSLEFTSGGIYTLTVLNKDVISILSVTDNELDFSNSHLSKIVLSIPRETNLVTNEKQSEYRHINVTKVAGFEETKGGVTSAIENINSNADIGKDLYTIVVTQSSFEKFFENEIITLGKEDTVLDSDEYYKVLTCYASAIPNGNSYASVWVLQATLPEIDDVYDEFSLSYSKAIEDDSVLDALSKAASAENFKKSAGYAMITKTLSSALSQSETYKRALSTLDDETRVQYLSASSILGLLNGLSIDSDVTFDDGFYAVKLSISGEITIKRVKINIQFILDDDIMITPFADTYYISLEEGRFVNSGTDVTNIFSFSIAASVTFVEKDEESGEEKTKTEKIHDEINDLVEKGVDDLKDLTSDAGISSLLGEDPEYVELFKVDIADFPISITNIITLHIIVDFKIELAVSAGIQFSGTYTVVERTGCTNGYLTQAVETQLRKNMVTYKSTIKDEFDYSVTLKGMLGIRAGVGVTFTVSVLHLNRLFNVGLGVDLGIYAELYGLCTYRSTDEAVTGALYFELGVYTEFNLSYKFLWWDGDLTLYEIKTPLIIIGDKNVPLAFANLNEEINIHTIETDLFTQYPELFSITYLNIKEMDEKEAVYDVSYYTAEVVIKNTDLVSSYDMISKIRFFESVRRSTLQIKITFCGTLGVWSNKPITKILTIHYLAPEIPEEYRYVKLSVRFNILSKAYDGSLVYTLFKQSDVYYGDYPKGVSVKDIDVPEEFYAATNYPQWRTTPIDLNLSNMTPTLTSNVNIYQIPITQNTDYYMQYDRHEAGVRFQVLKDNPKSEMKLVENVIINVPFGMTPKRYMENFASEEEKASIQYTPTINTKKVGTGWSEEYEQPIYFACLITPSVQLIYSELIIDCGVNRIELKAMPKGESAIEGVDAIEGGKFILPFEWKDGYVVYKDTKEVLRSGGFQATGFAISGSDKKIMSESDLPTPEAGVIYWVKPIYSWVGWSSITLYDSYSGNTFLCFGAFSTTSLGVTSVSFSLDTPISDGFVVYKLFDYVNTEGTLLDAIRSYYAYKYGSSYDSVNNTCTIESISQYNGISYYKDVYDEASNWQSLRDGLTLTDEGADLLTNEQWVKASFEREYKEGYTYFDTSKVYLSEDSNLTEDSSLSNMLSFTNSRLAGEEYDSEKNQLSCYGIYDMLNSKSKIDNKIISVNNFVKDGYSYIYKGWTTNEDESNYQLMSEIFLRGSSSTYYPVFEKVKTTYLISFYDGSGKYTSSNNSFEEDGTSSISDLINDEKIEFIAPQGTRWYHYELIGFEVYGKDINGNAGTLSELLSKDTRIDTIMDGNGKMLVQLLLSANYVLVWEELTINLYADMGYFDSESNLIKTNDDGKMYICFTGNANQTIDQAYNAFFNCIDGVSSLTDLLAPTRNEDCYASYAFVGWNYNSNMDYGFDNFGSMKLGYFYDTDFYAAYSKTEKTYTLTFTSGNTEYGGETLNGMFNGKEEEISFQETVKAGSTYYLTNTPRIIKTGYTFGIDYWTDSNNNKRYVNQFGQLTIGDISSDLTLVPHYLEPVLENYTLIFFAGDHCKLSKVAYTIRGTVEDAIDLSDMPFVSTISDEKNWKFDSWNEENYGTKYLTKEALIEALDGTNFNRNLIFICKAVEDTISNYSVTFSAYEGYKQASTESDLYVEGAFYEGTQNQTTYVVTSGKPNSTLVLPEEVPTRVGATFNGWVMDNTGVLITKDNVSSYQYTSNATYYASYCPEEGQYTITFNAGNGYFGSIENQKESESVKMYYGEEIKLTEVPKSYIEGYIFSHWAGANYATKDLSVYAVYGKPISTALEFMAINEDLDGSYVVTKNLDLGEINPIGSLDNPFSGALYGGGHSISFTIKYASQPSQKESDVKAVGLFSAVSGMISNLTYGNVEISYGYSVDDFTLTNQPMTSEAIYMGSIAGVIYPSGMIERIGYGEYTNGGFTSKGRILIAANVDNTKNNLNVGAFCGANYGLIENCLFMGGGITTTCNSKTAITLGAFSGINGGIISDTVAVSTAISCNLYQDTQLVIGGFVGRNTSGAAIKNAYTSANVLVNLHNENFTSYSKKTINLGAFAGINDGLFDSCVSQGDVHARLFDSLITDTSTKAVLGAELSLVPGSNDIQACIYTLDEFGYFTGNKVIETTLSGLSQTNESFKKVAELFEITFSGTIEGEEINCLMVNDYLNLSYVFYSVVGLNKTVWNVKSSVFDSSMIYELILK